MNENVCFYFCTWFHLIPWGYFGVGVFSLHSFCRHWSAGVGIMFSARILATMNCQTKCMIYFNRTWIGFHKKKNVSQQFRVFYAKNANSLPSKNVESLGRASNYFTYKKICPIIWTVMSSPVVRLVTFVMYTMTRASRMPIANPFQSCDTQQLWHTKIPLTQKYANYWLHRS
jgi:hypothetical protein